MSEAATTGTGVAPGPVPKGRWVRYIQDRLMVAGRAREIERIRSGLSLADGVRWLDVGGGTGAFSSRVADGGARPVVLEPDAPQVAWGRWRRPGLSFVEGKGERIPFPDGSFDCVSAIRSLHHMDDAAKFLAEARRVLDRGGRLLVEELNPASGFARWIAPRGGTHGGPHLHLLGPEALLEMVAAAGFRDPAIERGHRWYFATGLA